PFAPKAHLCAPIWNWGVYYTQAVQQVINGTWKPVNYYEGMNVDLVDVSQVNEAVAAPGTVSAIAAAKAQIANGSLFVFKGPIIDNAGKQIIAKGKNLTDKQITSEINYYIQGVDLL
ncbi:MAG: BMP family ABC transporter substrate-binding protein, partial [Eubacteriales bacterium]